ncbi:zinc finger protein 346-like isoform X2 [Hippocampus zosterae]|uniref:zinc finger protein 346-like isoform X2 n=1 Tax=Hippocampus zosterae TaxID=109293 RepID=UPI00223C912D|nr:zinc finger protein 346-like isoform X2 [Hippocampus zosterae]
MRTCAHWLEPRAQVMMAVAMDTDQLPYLPSGPDQVDQMIKEHGNLFTDNLCSVCNAVLISDSQKLAHYQSKKHGNKVRRYLSIQNEKEPETKKFKSLSSVSYDANNGESDPMKACEMCKMTFTSPVMAQSHYQGKIHAKKLKSVDPQTCQQAAPSQSKKKAAEVEVVAAAAAATATGNGGPGGDQDPERFCSICQASFNNTLMAQQHYSGKKHKKQLAKQDLMKLYGKPATPTASTAKGFPCTLCNIELNSVDQYQSHISGAKHKNQMKKSGLTPSDSRQASAPQNQRQSAGNDENHDHERPGNGSYQGGLPSRLLASGEDQDFVTEDNLFETEDNFFGIGGDIFPAADDQYDEDSSYATLDS